MSENELKVFSHIICQEILKEICVSVVNKIKYNLDPTILWWGRCSSVSIETVLRHERTGVRIPIGEVSPSPNCTDRSRGPPSKPFSRFLLSFSGVKRPGREVNHSPPSGAVVEAECKCACIPFLCLHDAKRTNLYFL